MRVLVATSQVPFVRGGGEILADALLAALRACGHEAELVAIPFKWYPPRVLLDHMLACRLIDIGESMGRPVDRVIALRFPAYLVSAPRKTLWLLHQHRTAHELWEYPLGDLIREPNGKAVRTAIASSDRIALEGIATRFSISRNVSARLERYTGLTAEPIYPPLQQPERFHCGAAEPFIFFPSRIGSLKRQALAVRAMAHVKAPIKLLLAGAPDSGDDLREIERLIAELDLADRVVILGAVTEAEKIDLYARCTAVLFPPIDEDYGYVTVEAMQSAKPVVTCADSGGPLEFVVHGSTGHVVDPNEVRLAEVFSTIAGNPEKAAAMGRAGRARIDALDLTWPKAVERLTA